MDTGEGAEIGGRESGASMRKGRKGGQERGKGGGGRGSGKENEREN